MAGSFLVERGGPPVEGGPLQGKGVFARVGRLAQGPAAAIAAKLVWSLPFGPAVMNARPWRSVPTSPLLPEPRVLPVRVRAIRPEPARRCPHLELVVANRLRVEF